MPPSDQSDVDRRAAARRLTCSERARIVGAEAAPPATRRGGRRSSPEFLGLVAFQTWLADSGRIADDGGSPWWRTVNGLLLLDVADSASAGSGIGSAPADPVSSWIRFRAATGRPDRRRRWWTAHQQSLETATAGADALFAAEPSAEQAFIGISIESVRIASAANLSTRRVGAIAIGEFCDTFYPSSYPALDDAGATATEFLGRHADRSHVGTRIALSLIGRRARGGTRAWAHRRNDSPA